MKIGEVINLIIKKKGITQIELAKKTGKSSTAISQIVNGVYDPNPETLDKICEEINVPKAIIYFLTISEKEIPEDKLELYKMLSPSIKDFLINIFGNEKTELIK